MPPLSTVVINSGSVVSQSVDLTKGQLRVVDVPALTSGDLLLQGAFVDNSANFKRLVETRAPGSGDMRFAVGSGSVIVSLPDNYIFPNYVRLETAVAQGGTRSFSVLTRP